jgi:ABC-type multidrug transport system ATPase subunit
LPESATFLGYPKLVVLDEPTNGVDTTGLIQLKKDIADAKNRKCIVIISSHVLDFVDAVSDKVLFFEGGKAHCGGRRGGRGTVPGGVYEVS